MNKSVILEDAISELNSILSSAQEQYNCDPYGFLSQGGIVSLGRYITVVANLCHSLEFSNCNELNHHLKNSSFSDLQLRWNNFVSELGNQSILLPSYPTSMPSNMQLLNADSNELINLEDIYRDHDRTLLVFLRHLA